MSEQRPVRVVVPEQPPVLTAAAAEALVRLLRRVAASAEVPGVDGRGDSEAA